MKMFKCFKCGKEIERRGSKHKYCRTCGKQERKAYLAKYAKTPQNKESHSKYAKTIKGKAAHAKAVANFQKTVKYAGLKAKDQVKILLKILKLPKNYDISKSVLDSRISNKSLEKITGNWGWPDFRKEALEEKGPKNDFLSYLQWARAILEYRAGRRYRVAWRFTSTRRKVFPTVFDFYAWQRREHD